jgi:hypothetical protein
MTLRSFYEKNYSMSGLKFLNSLTKEICTYVDMWEYKDGSIALFYKNDPSNAIQQSFFITLDEILDFEILNES